MILDSCVGQCVCVVVSKSKNSLLDVSVIRYGWEEAEKTNVNENRTTGIQFAVSVLFTRMFFVAV